MGRLNKDHPENDDKQIFDLWRHLVVRSKNHDFDDFGFQKCIKMEIRVTNRVRCVELSTFHADIGVYLFVYYNE